MAAMDWTPQPPPARTRLSREEKRQQTRSRLLEAAHALFAAKGLEATSVDEIAAAAGYTRGAFYANYTSKLDVMKELIGTAFDSDLEALSHFEGASSAEALAATYATYGRRFEMDPASLMWVMEFQMAAMRYPELREAYTDEYAKLIGRVRSFVARLLPPADASAEADTGADAEIDVDGDARTRDRLMSAIAETLVCLQPALTVHRLLAPERVPPESLEIAFAALIAGGVSRSEAR